MPAVANNFAALLPAQGAPVPPRAPRPRAAPSPADLAALGEGARSYAPGCAPAAKQPGSQRWQDLRVAVRRDLAKPCGYAHHLGWAGLGAAVGAGGLQVLRQVAPQAAQMGVLSCGATLLQVALPAAWALSVAYAATLHAAQLAWGPSRVETASLAALVGISLAPLALGLPAAGGAAALACGVSAAAALLSHAAYQQQHLTAGINAASKCVLAMQLACAPLAWSLAAGTTVAAAFGAAALTFVGTMSALAAASYLYFNASGTTLTPYADSFLVPDKEVQRFRADCLGEAKPSVLQVPPALVAKLGALQDNLRLDEQNKPYWLGLPIITLDGPPGTGKTSLAMAVAQKLDADLLATSASVLNRVYLPGLAVGPMRTSTLLAQAEQRAMRTGRLQVVFIDEMGALFPRGIDLSSADGQADFQGRMLAMLTLQMQAGRRNGVLVILADNHAAKSADALLAFSPQAPIVVAPPQADALQRIFADKLAGQMAVLRRKWGFKLPETLPDAAELQTLTARVGALATLGSVGRDASGIASQMRRAAEAYYVHGPAAAPPAEDVWAAMLAQGYQAAASYATRRAWCRAQPTNVQAQNRSEVDLDAIQSAVNKLVRSFADNASGAFLDTLRANLSVATDVQQSLDAMRVVGGFENACNYINDRLMGDTPYVYAFERARWAAEQRASLLHDPLTGPAMMARPLSSRRWSTGAATPEQEQATRARRATIFARQFEPTEHFDDTTFGSYPRLVTWSTRTEKPLVSLLLLEDNPYRNLDPTKFLYKTLLQRFAGQRRDTYRSELLGWNNPLLGEFTAEFGSNGLF